MRNPLEHLQYLQRLRPRLLQQAKLFISFSKQIRQPNLRHYIRDMGILMFKIQPYYYIDGWLEAPEAAALYRFAHSLPKGSHVVEIGCWKGKSTYCLARGLRPGSRVITIDPFDASGEADSMEIYQERKGATPLYDQFRQRMRELRVLPKIRPWPGVSAQFVGRIPRIDFLFVDGDHSVEGCRFDFTHYTPYIRRGGYLAFHDYNATLQDFGPTWVVENAVLPSGEYEFVGLFHTLWVARKI
jgi:hypothetical protein